MKLSPKALWSVLLVTLGLITSAYAYPPELYGSRTIIVSPQRQRPPMRAVNVKVVAGNSYLQEAKNITLYRTDNNHYKLVVQNKKDRLFWLKSRGTADRGSIGIGEFINATWFGGPASMSNIAPQAMLIGSPEQRHSNSQFVAAFTLSNPSYDSSNNITRYDATLVFNNTTSSLNKRKFYHAMLIIG